MTFKKIFALTMVLLLITGSVFSTSALAPPYSKSFTSESDMLTALSDYAEEYPFYDCFNFRSDIPKGYHKEYRQVLSVDIDVKSSVLIIWLFSIISKCFLLYKKNFLISPFVVLTTLVWGDKLFKNWKEEYVWSEKYVY